MRDARRLGEEKACFLMMLSISHILQRCREAYQRMVAHMHDRCAAREANSKSSNREGRFNAFRNPDMFRRPV
jgi:hypothetical protein